MADLKKQHVCIKFCFVLGENATETFKMLLVFFKIIRREENKSLIGFPGLNAFELCRSCSMLKSCKRDECGLTESI